MAEAVARLLLWGAAMVRNNRGNSAGGTGRVRARHTLSLAAAVTVGVMASAAWPAEENVRSSAAGAGEAVRHAAVQTAQAQPREFDIPPQPLASALTLFARQSDYQLAADTDMVSGLTTQGLSGRFPPDEALRRLLANTDITFRQTGPQAVTLHKVTAKGGSLQLDPIVVAGEKVERSYVNTYTSVGIATEQDIEDYNIEDLHDVRIAQQHRQACLIIEHAPRIFVVHAPGWEDLDGHGFVRTCPVRPSSRPHLAHATDAEPTGECVGPDLHGRRG